MRKIIALTLVLFSITYTQAQDWINNESTLLFESTLKSSENVQCIEEYDPDHLLTTTNRIGTKHYAFRLWENGNNVLEGFLNDTRCIISDIEVLGDSVYFCGNRDVNGNQIGYIGRFNIVDFINNQNCAYEIMDINTVSKLKKLVAYDTQGINHVVAIGSDITEYPVVVELFPDSVCNIFCSNSSIFEQLTDITIAGQYVIITGEETSGVKITITRFFKDNLLDFTNNNHMHVEYDYSSILDNVPLIEHSEQVKISFIDNGMVAVTTTGTDLNANRYYTLINIIDEANLNIINTQAIPHKDKMIKIKDTEYDFITHQLYVLEDNNIDDAINYESYIFPIYPQAQTSYAFEAIKPMKDYKLNDIISFSLGGKCIGIGTNSYPYQGIFSKKIGGNLNNCNTTRILKTVFLQQILYVNNLSYSTIQQLCNWQQDNFQTTVLQQIVECQ